MKTDYYIINPAGNITALVTSATEKKDYKAVCARIMEKHPVVEQVGFVRFCDNAVFLNMAGDEFCGNAVMSAKALYAHLYGDKNKDNGSANVPVTVTPSGLTVPAFAEKSEGCYKCGCLLPLPSRIQKISFTASGREYAFPAVYLEGITHVIADESLSAAAAKAVIKPLAQRLNAPALGIMLLDENSSRMKPLVYVRDVDTLFFESSCASGSCAAAYAKFSAGEKRTIAQPGGAITAEKTENGVRLYTRVIIENCFSEDFSNAT